MSGLAPASIGRYKVLQKLGAGAMGAVYLCQDPLLKRKVAVKVVLNAQADSEIMALRFQRESEISAQLNHPNIVTIFDVGKDALMGPFLTMEYVEGCSLSHRLNTAPPDARTAIGWLCQVGQALATAEKAGVVHRDIKPENILMDKEGRLKLSDFGLARNEELGLTTTGVLMGTPLYTAPELLTGKPADFATDRWALSVMAFQCVTGNRLPFSASSLSALLNQIAHEPPTIPEDMPAPLSRVFLKALHRDPARRYDSIQTFLAALAKALGVEDAPELREVAPRAKAEEPQPDRTAALDTARSLEDTPVPRHSEPPPAARAGSSRLTGPPKELFHKESTPDQPPSVEAQAIAQSPVPSMPSRPHRPQPVPRRETSLRPTLLVLGGVASLVAYLLFLQPWPVQFDSRPEGAEIVIDNAPRGKTPLRTGVAFGRHVVQANLAGYLSQTRTFRTGDSPVSFELTPALLWVDIVTAPAGADVLLGGQNLGHTPLSGILVPDTPQKLVLRLAGYRPWEGTLGPGHSLPPVIELQKQ